MKTHMKGPIPATTEARTILASCIGSVPISQCSLSHILKGILKVLAWAGNLQAWRCVDMSAREADLHVGTAAILLAGDRLLQCHPGKQTVAAFHMALEVLIEWLFPPETLFGFGRRANALAALAGLRSGHGLLLLKTRSSTKQASQVGRVLSTSQRAIFWPSEFPHVSE